MMADRRYKINPQKESMTIQSISESIKKGQELLEIEYSKITDEFRLNYNNSIILKPNYQREYRFSLEDESSIIESILVGIPIPPVFLASTSYSGVQVLDVVDGQHRLTAINRFITNKFKLKSLKLLQDLNGKYFKDLELDDKRKIFDETLTTYCFRDFPGLDFELEVFNRYNKGTKPLTSQEIRNAVYSSDVSYNISSFVTQIYQNKNNDNSKYVYMVYNFTEDRYKKKKIHESIFTILSIITYGINIENKDSTVYAENFMITMSKLYKENKLESENRCNEIVDDFNEFNNWIIGYFVKEKNIEYPFSRELYGIAPKNKFQPSIAMILAGIYYELKIKKDTQKLYDADFMDLVVIKIENSFINDPDYNASSTNSRKIKELINELV